MANKSFSVRISLDGGADIKKQLQDIGASGKKAFSDLEQAARGNSFMERLGTSVNGALGKLGELGTAFRAVGGAASEFGSKIGAAVDRLGILGGASLSGAVAGFVSLTKAAADAQAQLKNTADVIGVSAQQLKNLRDSFAQSGVDETTLDSGLKKLTKGIADAGKAAITYNRNLRDLRQQYNDGELSSDAYWKAVKKLKQANEDSLDPFTRLGIAVKNADGSVRDTHDALLDIADAFKQMPNGANKAGLAMEFFGSKNSEMIAHINGGRVAMIAAEKEAQRLAPALDDVSGAALDNAGKSFGQLGKTIASVKDSILATFAPQTTKLVRAFVEAIVRGRTDSTLYASTIADKVKPVVADLVALLEGRDSDVQNQSILKAKQNMIDFADATKSAIFGVIVPAFNALMKTLDLTVKAINAVFGTDLTAGQIAIVGVVLRLTGLFGVLTSGARLAFVAVGALVTTFGALPVAIAAAGFAIGYLLVKLVTDWEGTTKKIGEFWSALWDMLPQGAQDALAAVAAPFIEFGRIVGRIVAGVVITFASLFNGEFAANLGAIFSAAWGLIQSGAMALGQHLVEIFKGMVSGVGALFVGLGQSIQAAWDAVKAGAADAAQWIVDRFTDAVTFFTSLPDTIAGLFSAGWEAVKTGAADVAKWIVDQFNGAIDTVKGYLDGLIQAISSAASAMASIMGGGGGDSAPGYASGGYISGPGTGTSDSIHALVSNGEYVVQAKAVRRHGRRILDALNSGLMSVQDIARNVSFSGAVTALTPPVPRYAGGGLVDTSAMASGSSGHPVQIHLDGRVINGFSGSPGAIEELQRFATMSRVKSAGRAPTWRGK